MTGLNDAANAYFFDTTTGAELLRLPFGTAFAAVDGQAIVSARNRTFVIDIQDVPEPTSGLTYALLVVAYYGRRRRVSGKRGAI